MGRDEQWDLWGFLARKNAEDPATEQMLAKLGITLSARRKADAILDRISKIETMAVNDAEPAPERWKHSISLLRKSSASWLFRRLGDDIAEILTVPWIEGGERLRGFLNALISDLNTIAEDIDTGKKIWPDDYEEAKSDLDRIKDPIRAFGNPLEKGETWVDLQYVNRRRNIFESNIGSIYHAHYNKTLGDDPEVLRVGAGVYAKTPWMHCPDIQNFLLYLIIDSEIIRLREVKKSIRDTFPKMSLQKWGWCAGALGMTYWLSQTDSGLSLSPEMVEFWVAQKQYGLRIVPIVMIFLTTLLPILIDIFGPWIITVDRLSIARIDRIQRRLLEIRDEIGGRYYYEPTVARRLEACEADGVQIPSIVFALLSSVMPEPAIGKDDVRGLELSRIEYGDTILLSVSSQFRRSVWQFVVRARRFAAGAGQEADRRFGIAASAPVREEGLGRRDRRELFGRRHHQKLVHAGAVGRRQFFDRRLQGNRQSQGKSRNSGCHVRILHTASAGLKTSIPNRDGPAP